MEDNQQPTEPTESEHKTTSPEVCCRICYDDGDVMVTDSFCHCRGSLGRIHEECLKKLLKSKLASGQLRPICELCNCHFRPRLVVNMKGAKFLAPWRHNTQWTRLLWWNNGEIWGMAMGVLLTIVLAVLLMWGVVDSVQNFNASIRLLESEYQQKSSQLQDWLTAKIRHQQSQGDSNDTSNSTKSLKAHVISTHFTLKNDFKIKKRTVLYNKNIQVVGLGAFGCVSLAIAFGMALLLSRSFMELKAFVYSRYYEDESNRNFIIEWPSDCSSNAVNLPRRNLWKCCV